MTDADDDAPTGPLPVTPGELFQRFRDAAPRTRAEVARSTGLGRAAASARIDALVADGLLAPGAAATSTGGRPPRTLRFRREAGAVLAIDLGARHASVAVCDLAGEPLATRALDIDIAAGPAACLGRALDAARGLLAETPYGVGDVWGAGIGIPGPVAHSTGRPVNPPIMPGWDQHDIPGDVAQRWSEDALTADMVLVDNDVNLLALGEQVARASDTADLVYVKVATGIGAGIIAGGALQRGALGSAGDLGHIHVQLPDTALTRAGEDRELEDVASGAALARALRERGVKAETSADAIRLVAAGDRTAVELARDAGRIVGEAVAIVVNLLGPSLVVVGGSLGRASDHLIAGIREVVYRRSIPLATQHLAIEPSVAGAAGGVRGAAVMILDHVLAAERIDRRLAR
ncbi:ROK family protein [Microbacterium excoecariae]|uniref:ROK family protein n=1 Tax=Microbacterium excoecariae TaxID=2715210 RepID=UPI00140C8C54|nr:ROK family protein [Microbacterium excoecariae]